MATHQHRYDEAVFGALGALNGASAQDLFRHLRHEGVPVGLSTVYRTLRALVAAERVFAVPMVDEVRYEIATSAVLDTLCCVVCSRSIRLPRSESPAAGAGEGEFFAEGLPLVVRGRCSRCAPKGGSPPDEAPPGADLS